MTTPGREELRAFRHPVSPWCGGRREARFELLDAVLAVLAAPTIATPAQLRLVPTGQRGWGSRSQACNAGPVARQPLEPLSASSPLATTPAGEAGDARVWPRGEAETSPARGS